MEAGVGRPVCGGCCRKADEWRHGAVREEEGLRSRDLCVCERKLEKAFFHFVLCVCVKKA